MAIDERLVFLEGKHVLLKALSPQDVEESEWAGWFNDATLSVYNQHHYFPNTLELQLEHLKKCISPSKLQLGVVDRADPSSICGVVSLSDISWIHRHADFGAMQSAERSRANPTLFWESTALILKHGFEQLGLNKIYAGSFNPHTAAALVRFFNFEMEGVRRRHVFKDGVFRDVTTAAVFHDTVRYPEF